MMNVRFRYLFSAIYKRLIDLLLTFKSKIHTKNLPDNNEILVHLGCGDFDDSRYVNVDLYDRSHVHYKCNIEKLTMFENDSVDLIYACHCLEHISHRKTEIVLTEWKRCLKIGGTLRLSVPDFKKLVEKYSDTDNISDIENQLMGGQTYKYNFHYTIFDEKKLTSLLFSAGFSKIKRWSPQSASYHNFNDRSYSYISLNIEAIK